MKIRITSDTHNEFVPPDYYDRHLNYILPRTRQDKDSVLILAGDIWSWRRPASYIYFINVLKDRFKAIINLPGNHEYYGVTFTGPDARREAFHDYIKDIPNFHFLNPGVVVIDDTIFIGATLWTDFHKNNPAAKTVASGFMNDYSQIIYSAENYSGGDRDLSVEDIMSTHLRELTFLKTKLSNPEYDRFKKVVVTHHGCTYKSIHPMYENAGPSNYAFTSELSDVILEYNPVLWIHGHTHCSLDYNVGKTRVLVNPCGYHGRFTGKYENPEYNPKLIVNL
jgi:hypothetical protein